MPQTTSSRTLFIDFPLLTLLSPLYIHKYVPMYILNVAFIDYPLHQEASYVSALKSITTSLLTKEN